MPSGSSSATPPRAVLTLSALSLGLAGAVAWLLVTRPAPDSRDSGGPPPAGIMDSFPDPDVGRVLLAGLEGREFHGIPVDTNAVGLRERAFAAAKPPGVVRVVLLGDSYFFGWRVSRDERAGERLEAFLRERAPADRRIEVLTVAVPSWNILAECAFLRRQLDVLAPDLVVQSVTTNDLDDCVGVRGFGMLATFGTRHRERADGLVYEAFPFVHFGAPSAGMLTYGLDFESRHRYSNCRHAMADLADGLEAMGGRYRTLVLFGARMPLARRLFETHREAETAVWVAAEFSASREYRLSESDGHWSPEGHRQVALLLYGIIQSQELLPALELPPWDEARRAVEQWHEVGRVQARRKDALERIIDTRSVGRSVDFGAMTDETALQVHGGVDAKGRLSPYASMLLRSAGARVLRVRGRCLDRPQLDGARLRVFVDEQRLHTLSLAAGEPVDLRLELPAELGDREFVSVRFVAGDYVYAEEDLRRCVAFELRSVSLDG